MGSKEVNVDEKRVTKSSKKTKLDSFTYCNLSYVINP